MTARIISGLQVSVTISDQSTIGESRRSAKALAEGFGFGEVTAGRAGIIATEIATNIQRHAGTGRLFAQVLDDGHEPELEILGIDSGPGMADLERCMRDGYSTTGTAGQGLGALVRLSTSFDIYSTPDKGTVVMSRIARAATEPRAARPGLELGAVRLALRGELECGDNWRVADGGDAIGMIVVDGLGHGSGAAEVADATVAAYAKQSLDQPSHLMTTLHQATSGTRGAAVACALLHPGTEKIEYAGIGNIYGGIVIDGRQRGMVTHNGILGLTKPHSRQLEYRWPPGSLIVMHSDGLSARWNLELYPGLPQRHAAVIAGVLYRDFSRERDDATVVVARYRQ